MARLWRAGNVGGVEHDPALVGGLSLAEILELEISVPEAEMRPGPEGVPGDRLAEQFEGVVVALLLQVHPPQLEQLVDLSVFVRRLGVVPGAGDQSKNPGQHRGEASRGCDGMCKVVSRHCTWKCKARMEAGCPVAARPQGFSGRP